MVISYSKCFIFALTVVQNIILSYIVINEVTYKINKMFLM